ncbi:MAG: hypothetical protein ACQEXI_01035 [Pseudomonadota bacterium]
MSKQECPTCGHAVDEAYEQYRKEYKREWYQQRKKNINFNKWIEKNPEYKDIEDIKDLYLEYGGVKAKKIVKDR